MEEDNEIKTWTMGDRDTASTDPGPDVVAEANEIRKLALCHPKGHLLLLSLDGWTTADLAKQEGVRPREMRRWFEEVKEYVRANV